MNRAASLAMARALCAEMGITIIPRSERRRTGLGAMETCAEATIAKLIGIGGRDHAYDVLQAITRTTNNQTELVSPTIMAVSDLIRGHPDWASRMGDLLDALDDISLAEARAIAKGNRDACGIRHGLATVLYIEVKRRLSPDPQRLI